MKAKVHYYLEFLEDREDGKDTWKWGGVDLTNEQEMMEHIKTVEKENPGMKGRLRFRKAITY